MYRYMIAPSSFHAFCDREYDTSLLHNANDYRAMVSGGKILIV